MVAFASLDPEDHYWWYEHVVQQGDEIVERWRSMPREKGSHV
jgi:hypothetical protein